MVSDSAYSSSVCLHRKSLLFWQWLWRIIGCLLPRIFLIRSIRHCLCQWYSDVAQVQFYHSGRGGLRALLEAIKEITGKNSGKVLAPDYICNLVHRTVHQVGLEVCTYRTDDRFQADLDDVVRQVSRGDVQVVILASLLGANNATCEHLAKIRSVRSDCWVIFDECQHLQPDSSICLDNRSAILWSFNWKQVHGIMGGAVGLPRNWEGSNLSCGRSLRFREVLRVYAMAVASSWRHFCQWFRYVSGRAPFACPKSEYAACQAFPYSIEILRPSRLSLAWGWAGLRCMGRYCCARREVYAALREYFSNHPEQGSVIETFDGADAAIVPLKLFCPHSFFSRWPLKGPYASDEDSSCSIFPELYCYRNEGIWQPVFSGGC
jgi:hypothetical protein